MNRRWLLVLAVVALLLLGGCLGEDTQEKAEASQSVGQTNMTQVTGDLPESDGAEVFRFTDEEAGVTCWVFEDYPGYSGAGGLSCVPTNETGLAE